MELHAFTDNFQDNSSETGFTFTFYCDLCREGFKTQFVESKSSKKGKFFKGLGSFLRNGGTGYRQIRQRGFRY